jgi:hypothetical protein
MPIRGFQIYEPELIETMRLAFYKVSKALQLSDADHISAEIVVARIVELARTRESDAERLCAQVLGSLPEELKAS